MGQPQVSLSIDLDALDFYLGLYGLPDNLSERARDAIPARAIDRFCDLCASLGIPGTLFVVGRDVEQGRGVAELRAAAAAGNEIASHSYAHDYALTRQTDEAIHRDLGMAERVLADVTGSRPIGFRAPGYTITPQLLAALAKRGYRYDSSLFPSPPYYAAKATVMGAMALVGQKSRSILGPVGQLFRSRKPHRDASGLVELPIAVLPGARIPFYGTPIVVASESVTRSLAMGLARDPLVVIELHGVDLCDASDGIPPELAARARDLRIPAIVKRKRIEAAMRDLLKRRTGVTLAKAAESVTR